MPNYQGVWSLSTQFQNAGAWPSPPLTTSDLGILAGGQDAGSSNVNTIQYVFIATTGNANDFGDLTVVGSYMGMTSSSTRAVFMGGLSRYRTMDFVEMATAGNATDFGDISLTTSDYELNAAGNDTRGVIVGLKNTNSPVSQMDYITIASTGDSSDFGDLTQTRGSIGTAGSTTRQVMAGGRNVGTYYNRIDYITIASTGNATDFGDLQLAKQGVSAVSSSTRACFGGGFDSRSGGTLTNVIGYITIASTGNAADFGDLSGARYNAGGMSNKTRGIFAGGNDFGSPTNLMEYITVASTGNAVDFGDMTASLKNLRDGTSNAHGGLS
jgi:hypothetical protein